MKAALYFEHMQGIEGEDCQEEAYYQGQKEHSVVVPDAEPFHGRLFHLVFVLEVGLVIKEEQV